MTRHRASFSLYALCLSAGFVAACGESSQQGGAGAGSGGAAGGAAGAVGTDPTPCVFADPGLEAAVRDELGRPTGLLDRDSIAAIEILLADERNIESLRGIECLVGLKRLGIDGNRLSQLDPLATLTGLESLTFDDNDVSDLSPLSALLNLRALAFRRNKISDISPLRRFESLSGLIAFGNQIVSIEPLRHLPLSSLRLSGNPIADLSPLGDLTALRTLEISRVDDNSLDFMRSLEQLNLVAAEGNGIVDLTPLSALDQAGTFYLSDNAVADLAPLLDAEYIGIVWLDGNPLTKLSKETTAQTLCARGWVVHWDDDQCGSEKP